jgi:ADP-heptose:LPS heptosyltransferase
MQNALESLSSGARVAVIRLRSLGDCVLTTPALEILKSARPDLRIAVVVEDRFAAIFEGNPDVGEILPPAVRAVSRFRPDLCLNLHGGTRSMLLTGSSTARMRAGFAHFRGSGIYNIRIPTAQQILGVDRKVHTAEHLASAMFYLGAKRIPIPRAKLFADQRPNGSRYAVIHPVAAAPHKMWTAEGFLEVAQHLQDHQGLEPVFIAAAGEDLGPFSKYNCVTAAPLAETKSLLQSATLFVGNDSGPAHMAAAFGIPVVVLYGASDPVIWAPWKAESEILVDAEAIANIKPAGVIQAIDNVSVRR